MHKILFRKGTDGMRAKIYKADSADLEALLTLQDSACRNETEISGNDTIQALTEEFNKGVILKAVQNGEIIGSVRAYADGDTVYIRKLMVQPDHRGSGLEKRLLAAVEGRLHKKRFELSAGSMNEDNLRLFEKSGYTRFREETDESGNKIIFMEKKYDDGSYLAYGMIFGMLAGTFMGTLTDNLPIYISVGMCLGMTFSLIYKQFNDKKLKK